MTATGPASDPGPAPARAYLGKSLALLAASAETQRAWITRYGVPVDELALSYDDAYRRVPSLAAARALDPESVQDLRAIDALFARLSDEDGAAVWEPEALGAHPDWARARVLATAVLVREGLDASV
ncbi:hypothetical protein [Streptomyces sp. NPDC047046]|uniref:hypothetical protein n=1 Tax=Streptomyces sp. NPDC047046 TaxID=3155378 RepID=UPI0033E8F4D0